MTAAWTRFDRSQKIFVWLTAIFVISLFIADEVGAMLFSFRVPFLKDPVLLSAGIIPFPVTFILTDLLNEFYGKQGARFVTWVGFGMCLLAYIYLTVGSLLPIDAATFIPKPVFMTIYTQYTGMFLASLLAYLIGQMLDIQIFHAIRSVTKHRFIWLRATGSTVVSQLFDSLIVTFIAFWGQMQASEMLRLAIGNYSWKFLIAIGITPLLYLGHLILKTLMPRQEPLLEASEPEYR
ncbi:queuosine precursor transporter [Vampirovibrio sp.]|uniref:queuosine precursor transporter n=1 Tax=Vampirovibrio sp. TaxID=2717857 RepID=UPI003593F6B1